jgi:hypothetical protein
MTTVPRRTKTSKLVEAFRTFRDAKNLAETNVAIANRLRDEVIMPGLKATGTAHGEQGQHLAIDLPEPIDGFTRLVRRANKSRAVDIDAAEKMLKKKGVFEQTQSASVTITGITADRLEELLTDLAKLKLEKKYGVLPQSQTSFSQELMYAVYQRQRQELQEREDKGEKLGVRERNKYISEADLDALIVTDTTYSFHPEK